MLRQLTPEGILNALTQGRMQVQGSTLSEGERRAVAEYVAGRPLATATTAVPNRCTTAPPMADASASPGWNGWGNGPANTRFAANGGLTAADLPRLKLKWAFGYAGVNAARAQPTIAGGRLFVASENGEAHALDPKTGCTYWTFRAQAGIRTGLTVGPYKNASGSGQAVYFGDVRANAYAVDAQTGRQLWVRKVDEHPAASLTGAPTVADGRVFVPVQGLNEEGQGGTGKYPCCTFRGSLVALDANTGAQLWKTYMIDPPQPRGKNAAGIQMSGPAGGGIWSSPTVDTKRGRGLRRHRQRLRRSAAADDRRGRRDGRADRRGEVGAGRRRPTTAGRWAASRRIPDNPACPATLGPDYDFSASPSLATVNGRDLLVLPQKSGMAWAIDPDKGGEVVWQRRIGQGSGLGGQWGGAVDGQNAYFGVSDMLSPNPGGMRAVNLATGEMAWSVEPQKPLCGEGRTCRASQGAAVTVIPGAVLSGSLDGGMRAYSTADGKIVWSYDTNREFQTVNNVKAIGGGLEGPGAIVSGGMLYFNSGYGGFVGNPGNVLLAFGD